MGLVQESFCPVDWESVELLARNPEASTALVDLCTGLTESTCDPQNSG